MNNTNLKVTHKHVWATAIVAGLICLLGFVVYPKMVFGLDAPSSVVATSGDTEVLLEWTAPGEDKLNPEIIIGYRIYYTSGKHGESFVDTEDVSTTYTVVGLENDTEYGFEITTLSDGKESARSRAVYATPTSSDDVRISIIGRPSVATTETVATITWSTDVLGTSIVEYGPTSDFKGEVSVEENMTTEHAIEVAGLTSCAGYWFKVLSYDENSNVAESNPGEFKTSGCKGGSEILTYSASKIARDDSGVISVANSGRGIDVSAPVNLKAGLDAVAIEAIKLDKSSVKAVISTPSSKVWIGNAYSLKAFQDERTELSGSFDVPVEVTISYLEEDVVGIDENNLKIYHYEDGSGWQPLSNCVLNSNERTVTCETLSFSIFGLFGSTESPSSGSSESSSNTTQSSGSIVLPKPEIPLVDPITNPLPNTASKFERNLGFGQKNPEVKNLQIFLNNAGFKVALSGPGAPGNETEFFGPLTFAALVKFQEAHSIEILTPLGLTTGTGYLGPKTREFINSI